MIKRLLKNKGFVKLMLAQMISSIGDWLSLVAVVTLAGLKWNASPLEVSMLFLCLAAPMALFGPISGIAADRFNRKTLMVLSDMFRAGLILLLANAHTIWIVYICLFAIGSFSSVFIPAKNGQLKQIVSDHEMKSAMSISSIIDSCTKVLGPLLSGIFVAAFGTKPVFYIDSLTFVISAILLLLLPTTVRSPLGKNHVEKNIKTSFRTDFSIGFSYMKTNKFLFIGMVFLGTSLLLIQLADSQLIVLIRELPDASPDLFGYLVTGSGIGMFFSGLLLTKKTDYSSLPLMIIGFLGLGASFGSMALFTFLNTHLSIVWMPILGFLAGFSTNLIFVPYYASVQIETPVYMTGRVFGVIHSIATTATILGPLLGGWLSTVFGVLPAFIISSSLLILLAFTGILTKSKIEK
ncbi:MFS transporter [Calidifontibacillus erzurumensis]|uniref:MFS transporter n=1 Tax=Calidifontibacillus erzurumensis TaxID=2741433 RepID=A0A8J8KA21_9BACI|nr:MFS transporter [Calidifontibacillus erzurumensis]NSL50212.1 MFS transporter [Calidifontibacillus erzurumensis]